MAYQKLQGYRAAAVTPSDTDLIPSVMNGIIDGCVLYIGTAGNITVQTIGGDNILFSNHPVGYMPVQVKQVFATGTAAANIVAIW
jgi:hypothetical protein